MRTDNEEFGTSACCAVNQLIVRPSVAENASALSRISCASSVGEPEGLANNATTPSTANKRTFNPNHAKSSA